MTTGILQSAMRILSTVRKMSVVTEAQYWLGLHADSLGPLEAYRTDCAHSRVV